MTIGKVASALAVAAGLTSATAQASLIDRGGGLIYDSTLQITWLQNADYARSSNYDSDGRMNWAAASTWVDGLSYYDGVRGVTYDDWRLPTVLPVNGINYQLGSTNDGSTDVGYGNTSPASEMSHLWYVDLGNKGYCSPDDFWCVVQPGWGTTNTGPFQNLSGNAGYWSGSVAVSLLADQPWYFDTYDGMQRPSWLGNEFHAWAVRDGDVLGITAGHVPEPGSLALVSVAVAGLALVRRQRFGAIA